MTQIYWEVRSTCLWYLFNLYATYRISNVTVGPLSCRRFVPAFNAGTCESTFLAVAGPGGDCSGSSFRHPYYCQVRCRVLV